MTTKDEVTTDFAERLLKQAPFCILIPRIDPDTGETYWDDPDIIGPFDTFEEAQKWALSYAGAELRTMGTPEFEIACRREDEENRAATKPRN